MLDIVGSGSIWLVLENGTPIGKPLYQKWQAEERSDMIMRERRKSQRNCMTCGDLFESEGAHNRMCQFCRRKTGGLI